ncbi:MAG: hypothetical protein ACYTHK_15905 [Planctomycetota bacterium]|jgi:hypothetical protein
MDAVRGGAARRAESRRGVAWELIELHFLSRHRFTAIHKDYENTVAALVEERKKPREQLRLDVDDTRRLFRTEALQDLIIQLVEPLRHTARTYFEKKDVAEQYAIKASRIYHELSILLEEHLSVQNFPRDGSPREFARIFREVSEYYPQRLRRVRDLFSRAQRRLEELLPSLGDDPIVLRSAYLFRDELWPEGTQAGFNRFLEKMFPKGGAGLGYLTIAQSFFKAGFYDKATECARVGVATLSRQAQARSGHAQSLREMISELDSLVARAQQEQAALTEQQE